MRDVSEDNKSIYLDYDIVKENELFAKRHIQEPITYLTEKNLNELEKHCEKTIERNYNNGKVYVEHKTVLELIYMYKELQDKCKEKNKKEYNLGYKEGLAKALEIMSGGKDE